MQRSKTADYPQQNELKKGKKWLLQYAKAMYSESRSYSGALYEGFQSRAHDNIRYRMGLQDVNQYKKRFNCDTGPTSSKRDISYHNLSWEILSFLPEFVDKVVGKIVSRGYEITAQAIDPSAHNEKQRFKWSNITAMKLRKEGLLKMYEERTGNPTGITSEFEDDDHLDLYMNTDYKLMQEMAIEQAVFSAMHFNDYEELDRLLVEDLVTHSLACLRIYTDKFGVFKMRKCLPEHMILDYSRTPNFKDVRHTGEIIWPTIAKVIEMAGDQITDEEKEEIRKRFRGSQSKTDWGNIYERTFPFDEQNRYNADRVPVMDFALVTTDMVAAYEVRDTKRGFSLRKEIPVDEFDGAKTEGKRRHEKFESQVVYEGKWIVGTNIIFDSGPVRDQYRAAPDKLVDTKLPFVTFAPGLHDGNVKSLVERVIPLVNEYQILWLKWQQLIIKAKPPGVAVNYDAIRMIPTGKQGQFYGPLEVMDIYEATGNLYYVAEDSEGDPLQMSKIIEQLPNGFAADLSKILMDMRMLRETAMLQIGLNDATDAMSMEHDTLSHVVAAEAQATSNALEPIRFGIKYIRGEAAKHIAAKFQSQARKGQIELYREPLGPAVVDALTVGAEITINQFGFVIEDHPTDQEAAMLIADVQKAVDQGILEPEDRIRIMSIPNLKNRERWFAWKYKKNKEMAMQMEERKFAAQAEANAQAAQQAMQAELEKEAQLAQIKDSLDANAHTREIEKLQIQHQFKMEELSLKASIDANKQEMKEEATEEQNKQKSELAKEEITVDRNLEFRNDMAVERERSKNRNNAVA